MTASFHLPLFDCPHSGLAVWLLEQFGQHADGKQLPAWVLTMPEAWRQALLDGYVSADENHYRDGMAINTVSRSLAIGVMLLAASLGFHPVVGRNVRTRYTIEGRSGNMRPLYHVRWLTTLERANAEATENHVWGRIKSINPGQSQIEVFNLSVEEDESYIADGIVVHNCTNHSLAKGAQRKHLNQMRLPLGDEPPLSTEAEIRSRCMMWDPLRWAAKNRYMYIVLENVVDVAFWDQYDEWLRAWKRIDKDLQYEFEILYLNSQFFPPTPQSRDRWYFVAWQKGMRPPRLDYRPRAYCQGCGEVVGAVQSWKRPERPWGRYGRNRQYLYRCPRCACEVLPYYCPAFNAIEWSFPTQKIGEREKPLAPKTMERIRYGLEKFRGAPFTTQLNKTTTRVFPALTGVFPTQTGDNGQALVDPSVPFMLSLSHAGNGYVYPMDQPIPTQTARHETGMALPPSFLFGLNHEPRVTEMWEPMDTQTTYDDAAIVQLLSEQYSPFILDHLAEYRPRDLYWALSTVCASGNHQSIIFPPFLAELHGTSHAREVTDPLSTVCAGGQHHGLVTPPGSALPAWLVSYYNNGQMLHVSQPSPTMTTHDRCGLLTGASSASVMIDILECGFRMLQPDPEIKRAMAFPENYIVKGSRREQVKLYGNGVTSPVVEWIIAQCLEALAA